MSSLIFFAVVFLCFLPQVRGKEHMGTEAEQLLKAQTFLRSTYNLIVGLPAAPTYQCQPPPTPPPRRVYPRLRPGRCFSRSWRAGTGGTYLPRGEYASRGGRLVLLPAPEIAPDVVGTWSFERSHVPCVPYLGVKSNGKPESGVVSFSPLFGGRGVFGVLILVLSVVPPPSVVSQIDALCGA